MISRVGNYWYNFPRRITKLHENLTNFPISILPDKTPPEIESVNLNYMTGVVTIKCSETIDLDPKTKFNLSKIALFTELPNAPKPRKFYLDGRGFEDTKYAGLGSSQIISEAAREVNISMLPHMRWQVLGMYDEFIGINGINAKGNPVKFVIEEDTMSDISFNRNTRDIVGDVYDPEDSYVFRFVSAVLSPVGEGTVAVAEYPKIQIFNGTGINDNDRAKWVPNTFVSSEDCQKGFYPSGDGAGVRGEGVFEESLNQSYTGLITVKEVSGNMLAYFIASSKPYKLCYQFADEPFKLFENVLLYVKKVLFVQAAKFGSYNMAVVDVRKPFKYSGHGIGNGDHVKYVENARVTDDDCNSALPLTNAGTTGDKIFDSVAFITFIQQSNFGMPFKLCYKFGLEPFKLYGGLTVFSMDLEAADSTRALVNVPIIVTFFSSHISGLAPYGQVGIVGVNDKAKWVGADSSTCEEQHSNINDVGDISYRLTAQEQTVFRDEASPLGRATFDFLTEDESVLCYKFANEPYSMYRRIAMKSLEPKIFSSSDNGGARY